ncbi:MAG: LamG-like jellyroll fold domain-containing protein [Bacteroidota bacterium]|nr:LamG-like jellyroll fold domain-containing protein [Bacteroidota bacterium]
MLKNYFIKTVCLSALVFTTIITQAQLNYPVSSFQNITGTYTDLGTTGTAITVANSNDANSSAISIGFTFVYNGTSFTSFILNTNGVIKLGTTAPSTTALYTVAQNSGAGTGGIFNIADANMIAPFELDLVGTASYEFRSATTGAVGSRVCTIQWKNVTENTTTPAVQYSNFSFQCKLYESTNIIEFVYGAATASTNTSSFKTAQVGLKGSSTAAINMISITKGSTQAWNLGTALQGNYTGNNFNYGNNVGAARPLPVPGTTLRFVPIYASDMAIRQVYSLGKLPVPFGVPHTVKAAIKNAGSTALTNVYVSIEVTGTISILDSVLITGINAGIDTTISFPSYTPSSTGTNFIKVFVSQDNNVYNDTNYYTQIVNQNTYNYADPTVVTAGGVGFTGATGDFVAKFPYTGSASINQIGVNFSAGGNTLKVGIWDTTSAGTPGTLLWSSSSFSTLAGLNTIPVSPAVSISGTFFVGVIQTGTVNAAFSFQNESPIRKQTFYYTSPTGGTTWTDFFTTSSNFRFMIEPRLQLADDLGSTSIEAPCNAFPLGQGSINPIATFYNYGSNTQFAIKLRAKIYNQAGSVVYNDSSSLSFILPSVSQTVTFTSVFNPTLAGTYTIKTWSELIGDGDNNNDTATKSFTVQNLVTGVGSGDRIQFDGTDDYVMIPYAANLKPNTNFTVEAWVRPSSVVSIGTLYSKDSTTTDSSLTIYMVGATPQVVMRTANGSVALMASSSGSLFSWTHVAVTYDGSDLRIYVNGDTAGVASITGSVTCLNGPTYLGRRAGATLPANLGLENFMFWNTVRTESQIRLGMHTKVPALSSSNLMAYLRFDEGPGNLYLADASGNCNEALMNNFDQATCWFQSSLPLDTTLGTSMIFTNDNLQSFANKNLALKFSNLSGSAQVVAHYFKYLPLGFLPDTVIATTPKVSHNRHWAVYRYGSNSYDSVRASFTFPSGNLGASGTAASLYLTVRDNGASGIWTTARNPADSLDIFNQTAQFWLPQSISIKKQFGVASSGTSNPLPVKYLSFAGFKQQSGVKLIWITASEINNAHFVIERSTDGKNFDAIGKVKGAGNSQQKNTYSFLDMNVFSLNANKIYYRLKQFDVDGNNENSNTVIIEMEKQDVIFVNTILPNPFSDKLELSYTSSQDLHMVIEIININGEIMFKKTIDSEAGYRQINLDEAGDMPHGVYFMRLQYNGIVNIQKLLKLAN